MYQTNYTTFVFEIVTPGTYLFNVLAVNILGNGSEESTFITVFTSHDECSSYNIRNTFIVTVVGLSVTAIFCSVMTTVIICCVRKGKKQRRYKEGRKEPAQTEPAYDAPVCATRHDGELELKENICYSNKQYI